MRKFLFVIVFISGLTTLAVELAASRLLGNVFGTSNLVWASIIGLVLINLTIGYFIGGAWADRSPRYSVLYRILIWAALCIAMVPVISRPILRFAANAFDELQLGILFGSFAAVIVLLTVPVILLGTASPFAIRLAIQDGRMVGSVSGRIYAISTLGSFVGTFLPVLLLIPLVGTARTFLIISELLLVTALAGLVISCGWKAALPYLWTPLLILALAVWGLPGGQKASKGQVYEAESAYNYIQVLESGGYTMLRLNEGQGIHSIYHPTQLNYSGPWEQVLVAPFFNPPPQNTANLKHMAIIGLAAGTTARQAATVYANIQIDGFEIDPRIVDVARKYFDMNEPNLKVYVKDGRWGLEHSPNLYQVISIDAYRPPYIPFHLTTVEFFQIVRDHLTPDGVVVLNVGRAPNDRRLINTLGSTMRTVFASVHVIDLPDAFNSILFATVQPTTPANLAGNYLLLEQDANTHPLLLEAAQVTLTNLQPPPEEDIIFTDDQAPIEWLTNNLVLKFLLTSDPLEVLQ